MYDKGVVPIRLGLVSLLTCLASVASAQSTSVQSGSWSDPATWGGSLPVAGAPTSIQAGHTVTLDTAAQTDGLEIAGTLRLSREVGGSLVTTDNVIVRGVLDMGTPSDPVLTSHVWTFSLTEAQAGAFVGGPVFQPTDIGLWVFDGGRWDAHGTPVTRTWTRLSMPALAGSSTLHVRDVITDWPVGATVVITQSTAGPLPTTERRTIAGHVDGGMTLDAPLAFDHAGAVGLVSRTLVIQTDLENEGRGFLDPDQLHEDAGNNVRPRRYAHTMYLPGATGSLAYLELYQMGHYGTPGRYPTHHHRLGDGGRGMSLRGLAIHQSGFRCGNLHRSHGILVEDTVCDESGGGIAWDQQVSDRVTNPVPLHNAWVRNLVTSHRAKHFRDRLDSGIAGERLRGATGFWIATTHGTAHLGNYVAGESPNDGSDTSGYHWPEGALVDTTQARFPNIFVANESHGIAWGFHSWQNRALGLDVVGLVATGHHKAGILHGAYEFPLRHYGTRLRDNAVHYQAVSRVSLLQDSEISGGDVGVQLDSYVLPAEPWNPPFLVRNAFESVPVGVTQNHDVCDRTRGDETLPMDRRCAGVFARVEGNTFTAVDLPLDFGWQANQNTHWVTDTAVVIRADQGGPDRALFPQRLVTAETTDGPSGGLETPRSSLPALTTWTDLVDDRGRPQRDYTLDLTPNPPPTIVLSVTMDGSLARLVADVSVDTTQVEFYANWHRLATQTAAPYELTVDLATLPDDGTGLPDPRYVYLYARAFDGTSVIKGRLPQGGGSEPDHLDRDYWQRAYSEVVEIGPELLTLPPGPDPDPDPDCDLAEIQRLLAQVAQLQLERDQLDAQLVATAAARDAALQEVARVTADLEALRLKVEAFLVALDALR